MSQRIESFELKGGIDLATSSLVKKPGSLITAINYEPSNVSGYTRVQGYERYDGRPSPTESVYYTQLFTSGTIEPTVGDVVLGGTSGATAEVLAIVVSSGSWVSNDAEGYLVITKTDETWVDAENIRDEGDTLSHAVTSGVLRSSGATTDEDHESYTTLARESYRSDIQAVPGSGAIRGVWMLDGVVYAFRDNVGATECGMHKSTSSGWESIDLGGSIQFDTGSIESPEPGSVITQASSGATAVIIDTIYTGSWIDTVATGRIHLRDIVGTFDATGSLSWTGNSGTAVTTSTLINTLLPGGQYEFVNYNFQGQLASRKMFGVNGVTRGFQFDGQGFAFLYTDDDAELVMQTHTPEHVFAHSSHLFLGISSSVFHSAISNPLDWTVDDGAGEIATGDRVTGFANVPGAAMAIFDRNTTYILKGSSSGAVDPWSLETVSNESGAIEWSVQNMGQSPKYIDDRGIMSLVSVQEYGDFQGSAISHAVESLVQSNQSAIVCSTRSRTKNQYRVFFSDNTGLVMRDMGPRKGTAFTLMEYPIAINSSVSVEDLDGTERLFFGSDNGYVYEMDKGDSFDGGDIDYVIRLSFANLKTPRHKKRFFKAVVEVDNQEVPPLNFVADFSYGSIDIPAALSLNASETLTPSGEDYDSDGVWGAFNWDGQYSGQAEAYLDGSGLNMSLLVTGSSNYEAPHRLHGVSLHYGLRGIKR